MTKRLFERLGHASRIACGLGLGNIAPDLLEEGAHCATAILGQLATDQVHRLDAIRAFVNLGDAGVTDELIHAPLADVAVAAEHLLGVDRDLEPAVGQIAFDHRRQQRDDVVRGQPLFLGLRFVAEVHLQRAPQDQRPRTLIEA